MNVKEIIIIGCLLFFHQSLVFAGDDGILVSNPKLAKTIASEKEGILRELVNNEVKRIYLMESTEYVEFVLRQSQLQIFPQIATMAIQQVAIEGFKQDSIKETLHEAYQEAFDLGMDLLEKEADVDILRRNIEDKIHEKVDPLVQEPLFKRVIEEVMKQAVQQNQMFIAQTVAQRQMQLAAIQTQQKMMQQAFAKMYQEAMQKMVVEQMKRSLSQIPTQ